MPALKLEQFGGRLPAWDPHLLPNGQAADCQNAYLFSGALKGWRVPSLLRTLTNSAARFVYRLPTISETQALAYLVFVAKPNAGDTFTVGEITYTWTNALGVISGGEPGQIGFPYQVLIGATTAACAVNALAALTTDSGQNTNAGVLYGTFTVANPNVLAYPPGATPLTGLPASATGVANIGGNNYSYVQVGAVDFGTSFNSIVVAESTVNTRTTWLKDLLALADVTATYQGGSNPNFNNVITGPATWLEFLDQDTNVLRSQVVDDSWDRYYFASPTQTPQYNTRARITAGQPAFQLGVPAPGCSPGVSVSGGGDNIQMGAVSAASGTINGLGNNIYLIAITPTGDTQLSDIQVISQSTDVNCNLAAVVYADNGGTPGELLNTGSVVTGVTVGTNAISTFVNPSGLNANITYWIGFMTDSAETWQAAQGASMVSFPNTFANGPPGVAPSNPTLNNPNIQMFADLLTQDVIEGRAYVYTYVSLYNEEGPPSPATLVNGWSNGIWSVNPMFAPVADDLGVNRNLAYTNLYRTVTGTGGGAVFFYVCTLRFSDWAFSLNGTIGPWYGGTGNLGSPSVTVNGNPISGLASGGTANSDGSFTDTLPDNYVSLNNQLGSTNFFPPPSNLQGIIAMPNGMMAGFKANEVWFCQPYQPHAWPPGYVQTTEYPIVGLGVTNGALVAATSAAPYVFNGINPGAITPLKCPVAAPCLSRGSILSGEAGVTFMSPNGLMQVTTTGLVLNTTDLWFTREGWQTLTPQKYTRAIFLASCYFCFGSTSPLGVSPADNSVAQQGFTIELDQDNQSFSIWPQPGGHRLGFIPQVSHLNANIDNLLTDPWTGIGMVISNGNVYYYDFSNTNTQYTMVPYTWKSKIYQQNTKKNYSAIRVFFTRPPNSPVQAACPNEACADDPSWNTLAANQLGIIKTYADVNCDGEMVLVDCREIRRSGELLRIVGDFKAEQWSFEILGRVIISNVQIATSVKELSNV